REAVLRRPSGFTPAFPRAVVDADAGRGRHAWLDPSRHHHAWLTQACFEDNGGCPGPHAAEMELVTLYVEEPARHRMRRPILRFADPLVRRGNRGKKEDSEAQIQDHASRQLVAPQRGPLPALRSYRSR